MTFFRSFFLIWLVAMTYSCQSIRPNDTELDEPIAAPTGIEAFDACDEIFPPLSQIDRKTLATEKIVRLNDDNHYLISEELTKDCVKSIQVGRFIWLAVSGLTNAGDREFARRNSKMIISILRTIWDSKEFSSDGTAQEKYGLLQLEVFSSDELAPFVLHLVETEDMFQGEAGLQSTIINRKFPGIEPGIRSLLDKPDNRRNIDRTIFLLIALYHNSSDRQVLGELRSLGESPNVSEAIRSELAKVIGKLEARKRITYEDIDRIPLRFTRN